MTTLFNKLKALGSEEPPADPQPLQCECGAHVAGECPECDGQDEPLQDKLQALGDAQPVNPPVNQCTVCGKEIVVGKGPTCSVECQEAVEPPDKETCPHCGKAYKSLKKHFRHCKMKPADGAEPPQEHFTPTGANTIGTPISFEQMAKEFFAKHGGMTTKAFNELAKIAQPAEPPAPAPADPPAAEPAPVQKQPPREALAPTGSLKPDPVPAPDPEPPAPVTAPQELQVPLGYMLIIDAVFEACELPGVQTMRFETIIQPLADAVAKENQVEHWATVPYAQGGPLLAAKLERWINKINPVGIILADSRSHEVRACFQVLKFKAHTIIQGTR
jgi:hypothetical protein